jgi:hypothetical protein
MSKIDQQNILVAHRRDRMEAAGHLLESFRRTLALEGPAVRQQEKNFARECRHYQTARTELIRLVRAQDRFPIIDDSLRQYTPDDVPPPDFVT